MEVHDGGVFGGSPLDRRNNQRADPAFLESCIQAPDVRVMVVDSTKRVLTQAQPEARLAWLRREAVAALGADLRARSTLLLGELDGAYHFAVRVGEEGAARSTGTFRSLRSVAGTLPRNDAAIAAHAVSLCFFHDRHRFCGMCGAPVRPEHGGTRLRCERNHNGENAAVLHGGGRDEHLDGSCSGVWFPRIDCVSIMLVVDSSGDRCLLGRQPRFPPAMWSCLAGFMEHGERVEDSARREVFEEAGIKTRPDARYFGCQPWPQPYSLMLGCVLQGHPGGEDIQLDRNELEDARWFSREEVAAMVANTAEREKLWSSLDRVKDPPVTPSDSPMDWFVPPPMAIAGAMLAAFARADPITLFSSSRM